MQLNERMQYPIISLKLGMFTRGLWDCFKGSSLLFSKLPRNVCLSWLTLRSLANFNRPNLLFTSHFTEKQLVVVSQFYQLQLLSTPAKRDNSILRKNRFSSAVEMTLIWRHWFVRHIETSDWNEETTMHAPNYIHHCTLHFWQMIWWLFKAISSPVAIVYCQLFLLSDWSMLKRKPDCWFSLIWCVKTETVFKTSISNALHYI